MSYQTITLISDTGHITIGFFAPVDSMAARRAADWVEFANPGYTAVMVDRGAVNGGILESCIGGKAA